MLGSIFISLFGLYVLIVSIFEQNLGFILLGIVLCSDIFIGTYYLITGKGFFYRFNKKE